MMNNGPPDNAADKAKQDAEEEEPKKIIRLITVTAYMISVSFVGLSLSTYYIFLWNPPNPRLMHAQARESHSERLIDDGLMASRRIAENEIFADRIDLFSTQRADDAETLKTRREIVDTVNAILRAKFEQTRSSSEAPLKEAVDETFMLRVLNNSLENPSVSFVPNNITEIVTTVTPESSSPPVSATEDNKESSSPAGEESTPTSTDDKITTDSTASLLTDSPTTRLPTRWTKSHVKKQHQTPFALKHLEVPIKSGGARKRPLMRIMTTTRRSQLVSLDAKETSMDGTTPLSVPSTESSRSSNVGGAYATRSLYKTLTTPASRRDDDYLSSTDFPEQLVRRPNGDDYQDERIVPAEDVLDD